MKAGLYRATPLRGLLGEQYQKAGYTDDARQIWQRGATLFPNNNTLREKLAGLQPN
ncbi:MAG TPA: hypothetical protein VL486_01160 [Verrucomicrobiae bacterium]|nr:hypothetical protein [Verrucomicrobiae bacterium]